MKGTASQENRSKHRTAPVKLAKPTFEQVLDGRKQRVRGLWKRGPVVLRRLFGHRPFGPIPGTPSAVWTESRRSKPSAPPHLPRGPFTLTVRTQQQLPNTPLFSVRFFEAGPLLCLLSTRFPRQSIPVIRERIQSNTDLTLNSLAP